ncbi:TPA: DUF2971 domain-containing protein [Aeromonas hydrophila]|uniref:DUF2971 domain-containing protein n=1 Tax=Aeromonas hydrophila TaxID=644 RepID=UPI0009C05FA0|nr:DUF2971 domain-containing protein [Aeromonas hydrophila]HAU4875881.1 DUF2971 domain-containing protein [Aeromonas hydrophila]HAU4920657.1 DUF2971 domain-containing protein [Aeromonas hydrophila]
MGNDIIYHYTSADGLRGILSNKGACLRMTDSRFLNDKEEITHGSQLVKKLIDKYDNNPEATLPGIPSDAEFMSALLGSIADRSFYSTSFSSETEQLSQWLSYCPQQGGYAIGFDKQQLRKYLHEEKNEIHFSPVNYVNDLNDLVKQINHIKYNYSSINVSNRVSRDMSMYSLVPQIERTLATSKQSHFESENEVRAYLVKPPGEKNNDLQFFTKGSVLVPYNPLNIPKEIVTQIIVGPMQHQELAMTALNEFRRVNKYDFEIIKSSIPFRCF